jgi:hypothetical protein
MAKTYTDEQFDEVYEEMNRQKGIDEELAALTPQDAIDEYRRLTNQNVTNQSLTNRDVAHD